MYIILAPFPFLFHLCIPVDFIGCMENKKCTVEETITYTIPSICKWIVNRCFSRKDRKYLFSASVLHKSKSCGQGPAFFSSGKNKCGLNTFAYKSFYT